MVDVNNELVMGIVGALTGKNEKDKFYVLGLCRRREVGASSVCKRARHISSIQYTVCTCKTYK